MRKLSTKSTLMRGKTYKTKDERYEARNQYADSNK